MKVNQRVVLTKRLLQEALLRLMNKKPLDKITVKELCEESGINRTTFYRHYGVPRDVLIDMEADFSNQLRERFDVTKINDISSYSEELLTYLYNHSDILKILILNNSADDFMRMINSMFEKVLQSKSKYPAISGADDDNIKLISTYIAGGGYFMLRRWLLEDIRKTPKELSDLILKYMNYSSALLDRKQNQKVAPGKL